MIIGSFMVITNRILYQQTVKHTRLLNINSRIINTEATFLCKSDNMRTFESHLIPDRLMKRKTILICDDDESIIEILRLILSNYGFSVVSEVNSLNIFSVIEQSVPDLLLVDLWMPALNGDVVIRHLKSNPTTNSIPI